MATSVLVALVVGVVVGAVVAVVLAGRQRDQGRRLVEELRAQAASERDAAVRAAVDNVIAVAGQSLGAANAVGASALDTRQQVIDRQVQAMSGQLSRVVDLVGELERDRERKFGELASQLQATARATASLDQTATGLREALSSPRSRGQWGERMADDVLRMAGFVEGVNYERQRTIDGGRRPDFTFPLPRGHVVHMDAKFPLAAYLRFLEAATDAERDRHRAQFLRDVRDRVRELARRDYVDPATTLDYVLCFIPNEGIYSFMHEADTALLDDALRQKVVFCSPLSLFAVLAVIRQAYDSATLEQTADEVLGLLGTFATQYEKFCEQLDKLGRGIATVEKAYGELAGTRRRALERPLDRLEDVRRRRGVAVDRGEDDDDEGGEGDGAEPAGDVRELPSRRAG